MLLLALGEHRVAEQRVESSCLLQTTPGLEENLLDLGEDFAVVEGSGGVCEIKRLLDAQRQPMACLVLWASSIFTFINRQHAAGSD